MRTFVLVVFVTLIAGGRALAQTPAPPAVTAPSSATTWSFSAATYTYIVADDRNYVQPTVTADRGWLHLETRFNYEDFDTGSVWLGYNVSAGSTVTLEFTPMIGGVFGNTNGIAPGFKGTVGWRAVEFYSETEYVFDAEDSANNFLYTWSELAVSPVDWFRFGVAVQRTRVYEAELDIERGVFADFTYKVMNVGAYVFDSGASRPTIVLSLGASF